jgi:hypothetical protein
MSALSRQVLLVVAVLVLVCGCAGAEPDADATCDSRIHWSGFVSTDADELVATACVNEECVGLAFPVQTLQVVDVVLTDGCSISDAESGTGWHMHSAACRGLLPDGSTSSELVHVFGKLVPANIPIDRLKDGDLATLEIQAEGVPILTAEERLDYQSYTVDGQDCKSAEFDVR